MPVTIKKSQLMYKNPSTGEYVSVDAVADKTSQQQINGINTAASNAIASINTAMQDIDTQPLTTLPKKAYKKDLVANEETLASAATHAYAVGDYFFVADNNNDISLYKATAAIAVGATISPGTGIDNNCVPAALADDVTSLSNDIDTVKADLDAIAEQASGGLTVAIKDALLTCLGHAAWDDNDPTGQSYINALESAFNMGTLTRITAAYTQSESVYWDTPLEALKSDLVVTGYWSNGTTTIISASNYALSGDLSSSGTITVSCDGKTTTFTVTVSAPLYPLENGEHTFTTNSRTLTITKGHHFAYTAPNATASNSPKGAYLNLSPVSDNNTSATTDDNITLEDVLFTIPSGASVVFKIKNIHLTTLLPDASTTKYAIALRNGDGSTPTGVNSGNKRGTASSDITISTTASADTPITCVMMYISNSYSAFEADICLTVNGERWI